MELLKKFSQEKYEEGRKQEYLARKQGRNEDSRKYYMQQDEIMGSSSVQVEFSVKISKLSIRQMLNNFLTQFTNNAK